MNHEMIHVALFSSYEQGAGFPRPGPSEAGSGGITHRRSRRDDVLDKAHLKTG
jgi:hypothetical protein